MVKSSSSSSSKVIQYTPNASIGVPSNSNTTATTQSKRPYKGVRMRSWGSWVSEIRAPNQKTRIWLGSYSTPEAAARAYDAALVCLKGSTASLNFPVSANHHHYPTATLMSPKSIQRVAAAAANATTTTAIPLSIPAANPPPLSPPSSDTTTTTTTTDDSFSSTQYIAEEESMPEHEQRRMIDTLMDFTMFDSPKCMDPMLGHYTFAPCQPEEYDEEAADILLWSFS